MTAQTLGGEPSCYCGEHLNGSPTKDPDGKEFCSPRCRDAYLLWRIAEGVDLIGARAGWEA